MSMISEQIEELRLMAEMFVNGEPYGNLLRRAADTIEMLSEKVRADAPSIDIVRCKECRKSHIDGKTTHYLWCTEWGRSTDTFGYCERGEREGE